MDPARHANLSAKRRGGAPEDYLAVHRFFDTTKELCSDNRHRLLHNPWGIRRVVLPLFGNELAVEDRKVFTKDVCEVDHVLADFSGKYLPTLADFTAAIRSERGEEARFEEIRATYQGDDAVMELLLSPHAVTGHVQSLLVTHNTWFLAEVLPRLFPTARRSLPHGVPPAELFARRGGFTAKVEEDRVSTYVIRSQSFFYTDEYFAPGEVFKQVVKKRFSSKATADKACAALVRKWVRSEPIGNYVFDDGEAIDAIWKYLREEWPDIFAKTTERWLHEVEIPSDATDAQVDAIVKRMGVTFAEVFEVEEDQEDQEDDEDESDEDYEDDLHFGPS